jgi:4-amino-4-deoxy-L-arabinose transferase-like glycosyltransferase
VEIALFLLFIVANTAYLHRVPGLMGDEAHEGGNVFRLIDTKTITFQGERSYIGPLIDYNRVSFVLALGYSALALRVVMLMFSIATFLLTISLFKKVFGKTTGLIVASTVLFSPIYLGEQRMAWAITLNVFFAVLLLWAVVRYQDRHCEPAKAGAAISSLLFYFYQLL